MPKPYESMSFLDFPEKYQDDAACEQKLFSFRWPNGFVCPKCGHAEFYDLPKRSLYQCKNCKYQASLTAGTEMHKTRTSLLKWFWAIILVITDNRGISALDISRKISVSYKTAWGMLHKIRIAMGARDSIYHLAGLIQIDDAFFKGGVNKGDDKRGSGTSKVAVLVMTAIKKAAFTFAKMDIVVNVDSNTIKKSLEKNVTKSQAIKSDGFTAYNIVKKMGHEHVSGIVYPVDGKPNFAF